MRLKYLQLAFLISTFALSLIAQVGEVAGTVDPTAIQAPVIPDSGGAGEFTPGFNPTFNGQIPGLGPTFNQPFSPSANGEFQGIGVGNSDPSVGYRHFHEVWSRNPQLTVRIVERAGNSIFEGTGQPAQPGDLVTSVGPGVVRPAEERTKNEIVSIYKRELDSGKLGNDRISQLKKLVLQREGQLGQGFPGQPIGSGGQGGAFPQGSNPQFGPGGQGSPEQHGVPVNPDGIEGTGPQGTDQRRPSPEEVKVPAEPETPVEPDKVEKKEEAKEEVDLKAQARAQIEKVSNFAGDLLKSTAEFLRAMTALAYLGENVKQNVLNPPQKLSCTIDGKTENRVLCFIGAVDGTTKLPKVQWEIKKDESECASLKFEESRGVLTASGFRNELEQKSQGDPPLVTTGKVFKVLENGTPQFEVESKEDGKLIKCLP